MTSIFKGQLGESGLKGTRGSPGLIGSQGLQGPAGGRGEQGPPVRNNVHLIKYPSLTQMSQ